VRFRTLFCPLGVELSVFSLSPPQKSGLRLRGSGWKQTGEFGAWDSGNTLRGVAGTRVETLKLKGRVDPRSSFSCGPGDSTEDLRHH
jgi:hypothetical protein